MSRILKYLTATAVLCAIAGPIAVADDQIIFDSRVELHQSSIPLDVQQAMARVKLAIITCNRIAYDAAYQDFENAGGINAVLGGSFLRDEAYDELEKDLRAGGLFFPKSCDPLYTVTAGGRVGTIDRGHIGFFRTELGGVVMRSPLLHIYRDSEDFNAIDTRTVIHNVLPPLPPISDETWDLFFGYSRATSNASYSMDRLSAGGNQLGILSPAGQNGVLGGGVVTGAGLGDVTGLHFKDNYREEFFRVGTQNTFTTDTATGALVITPRIGAFFGTVDEKSRLSGTTNGGTFDFNYRNRIETDRIGLEAGVKIELKLPNGLSAYIDGDARFIHNQADGNSRLRAGNFIPEIGRDSRSSNDFGGVIGAGLSVENANVRARIGVEYETSQIPILNIPGTREAFLTFTDRESLSVRGELTVYLAPQLVNPDQ